MNSADLAKLIDHTLLRPDAEKEDIARLCDEAIEHGFYSVCVQPTWVTTCAQRLAGSSVTIASVVSFPHGHDLTEMKMREAGMLAQYGASEIDVVARIPWIKDGGLAARGEITGVVGWTRKYGATVKVIIECCYLTDEQKRRAAEIVAESGATFVKTSTGFGPSGATVEDVRLLRSVVGDRCGVKAAGGIRDLATVLAMLDAGANRIGTSAGVALMNELAGRAARMYG